MRALIPLPRAPKVLSRRALEELNSLQASVQAYGSTRSKALRIFVASRNVTKVDAQREFWLEFSLADQEYRFAVRRLAAFCDAHALRRKLPAGRP
ncbi:MAG TPA: hypothetical protein VMU44_10720 [Steroidobacteraceae bacterium]|nr:hypothetical protein [Steroidobacteraceae bacterium]